jgi:hypothetical protein
MSDIRYALRTLVRQPIFTLVAVLTLALAVGANTAIFSQVRALLLAPLPYPDASRLVLISESNCTRGLELFGASSLDFRDWVVQSDAFDELAAFTTSSGNLQDAIIGDYRTTLLLLWGAAGFVLLLACVNIANLLLARAADRQKEMAIRVAMGASFWRILRQLLIESTTLGVVASAVGVVFAAWMLRGLQWLGPSGPPRATEIVMDTTVLAVAALLGVATSVVFGFAP